MKIILIWVVLLFVISYITAEIIFKVIKKKNQKQEEHLKSLDLGPDADLKNMGIENVTIVPSASLQMRGSWRLAKQKNLSYNSFSDLKKIEYGKRL